MFVMMLHFYLMLEIVVYYMIGTGAIHVYLDELEYVILLIIIGIIVMISINLWNGYSFVDVCLIIIN